MNLKTSQYHARNEARFDAFFDSVVSLAVDLFAYLTCAAIGVIIGYLAR